MHTLTLRPFTPADQPTAKAIVLAGMTERWGKLDPTLNPDLNDIHASFIDAGDYFFVGEVDGQLVATGALTHEAEGVARIVRMSVLAGWQGCGFGRNITQFLIDHARKCGYREIVVETNADWTSAVRLYQTCGFIIEKEAPGDYGNELHMRQRA